MTALTDEQIAIHEAGHVVAGWLLGWHVESATIEPVDGHRGLARVRRPARPASSHREHVAQLRDRSAVMIAGDVAESLHLYGEPRRRLGGSDEERIRTLLRREFVSSNEESWIETAQRRAHALLAPNWHAVAIVAALLLERRALDEFELRRVLQKCLPSPTARADAGGRSAPSPTPRGDAVDPALAKRLPGPPAQPETAINPAGAVPAVLSPQPRSE